MKRTILIIIAATIGILIGCGKETNIEYYDICRAEAIAVLDSGSAIFVSDADSLDFDSAGDISVSDSVKGEGGIWIQHDGMIEGYERSRSLRKHRIYGDRVYMLEKVGGSWYTGGLIQFDLKTHKCKTILKDCFCYDFEKSNRGLLIFMDASSSVHKSDLETGLYLYDPDAESLELIYAGRCFDLYAHGSWVWLTSATEAERRFIKIDLGSREEQWTITFPTEERHIYESIPCGQDAMWVLVRDSVRDSFSVFKLLGDGSKETAYQSESGMHAAGFAGTENELYVSCFSKEKTGEDGGASLVDVYRLDVSDGTMTTYLSGVVYGKFFASDDRLYLVRRQSARGDMLW